MTSTESTTIDEVEIASIADELHKAGDYRHLVQSGGSTDKKNYAETLSRELSTRIANDLRSDFPGILPDRDGKMQESRARTAKGFKKLDVNYSTSELGLALGVSVKTLNFRDGNTDRYTKNFTRIDNELGAETAGYHERQPYAVMAGVLFLPLDACDDGSYRTHSLSSFAQAITIFRPRAGRDRPADSPFLFERLFIALYDTAPDTFGELICFDVTDSPPKKGRPRRNVLSYGAMLREIVQSYDRRNRPPIDWAD